MPIVSDRMKKEAQKAEREARERREREEHAQREERARQEREEYQRKLSAEKRKKKRIITTIRKRREKVKSQRREKELIERHALMRKSLANIKKGSNPKVITDESLIENHGYKFVRQELTRGRFSTIYKARCAGNDKLALKMIILDNRLSKRYRDNVIEESLKIIKYVGSGGQNDQPKAPQFVKIYEIFQTPQKVYIFMDEYETLSIEKRIRAGDTITEYEARKWAKQVAEGIDFLHKSGIAHRNVRSENVIFDMENNTKLVGLDYACIFWDSDDEEVIPQEIESPSEKAKGKHLPPEVFAENYDASAVDVWSLGVLICQLLTKEKPFSHESTDSFEKQWENFKKSHKFTYAATTLLDQLFQIDMCDRIDIQESLKIQWFKRN